MMNGWQKNNYMENKSKIISFQKIEKVIDSREGTADLIECIKSLEIKATPIGEGGNAVVYAALGTNFDRICLKKIKEKPQIMYNDIDKEHQFQIMARNAGVRTPFSIMSIKTDDGEYLIMEKIEGSSIEEIIQKPELLSEKFNFKTFCDSLEDQIAKMHKAGIYHRDLHSRNVMIDKEGLPVIIDFGTATEGTGSDFTYEESISMYDEKKGRYNFVNGYFKDDLEMVKNIKSSVKNLNYQDRFTC